MLTSTPTLAFVATSIHLLSLKVVLVECLSAVGALPGNQELHEKIIVAYSPLKVAEPTLLDFLGTRYTKGLLLLHDVPM